jgi:hypothetical protein
VRATLTAARREDRTAISSAVVGMGWRASVRGSAVIAMPVSGVSAVAATAAFADSFTLALDTADTSLSTIVTTRFSPLAALGMLTGLFFFGLLSARLVHDVAEAACSARGLTKTHGRSMWASCLTCMGCASHGGAARLVFSRPPTDIYAAGAYAQNEIAAQLSSRNLVASSRGLVPADVGAELGANAGGMASDDFDAAGVGMGDGGGDVDIADDPMSAATATDPNRRTAIRTKLKNRMRLVGLFSRLGAGAASRATATPTQTATVAPELGPVNPLMQLYRASKRRLTGGGANPAGGDAGGPRPRFGGFEGGYVPGAITTHSWLSRRTAEQRAALEPGLAPTRQKMPQSFLPKEIAPSDKEIASKGFRFSVVRSALQSRGGGGGVASSSSKVEEQLAAIETLPNAAGE